VIPIRRGEEPEPLREVRFWRLARVMLAHLAGNKPADAELVEYERARSALRDAQGNKCAYCEMLVTGGIVEHFRPKSVYFWLTWSYNNLFFSCSTCNDPAHKGSAFELFDPSAMLQPGEEPPGREQPKLLDPGEPAVNPVRCIEFVRLAGRWTPVPRAGNPRGKATIETFGLDQSPIIDHYQTHAGNFEPWIQAVRAAMQRGDEAAARTEWGKLIRVAFFKTQAFHALMYDVIAAELPEPIRASWGLVLPEPGAGMPPDPAPRDRVVQAHQGLPERLELEVRALGGRPAATDRDEVLVKLCAHRPFTCAELAAVLEREEVYLSNVLRKLVATGHLTSTASTYQASPAPPPA
jgi:uncharacterized protein (TIGR02646 family)